MRSKSSKENQSFELVSFYSQSLLGYFGLCFFLSQESLSCRLVFVMMQYCVAANYYWLLVEGMYLYTLLVLSVFSEQRIFRLYLCIGWGKLDFPFVLLWLHWQRGSQESLCVCPSAAQFKSCTLHSLFVPNPLPCLGWRVWSQLLGVHGTEAVGHCTNSPNQ